MAETKKPIEEYAPGAGHPHTLDGYRDWCAWRDHQETEKRRREAQASIDRGVR